MGLVLTVHFRRGFYEYFTPGADNRAFIEEIPGSDVYMSLEVWNGVWWIRENPAVRFVNSDRGDDGSRRRAGSDGAGNGRIRLSDGLRIACLSRVSGEKFTIVIADTGVNYTRFEKYALNPSRITIGREADNMICFSAQNLVSSHHAVIETGQNGVCAVTDTSSNGVFVNGRRVNTRRQLEFGDTIGIFGLKIVYLGDCIAVNQPAEDMRIHGLIPQTAAAPGGADTPVEPGGSREEYYQRSPRLVERLDTEPIEIDAPPNAPRGRRQPLLFTIGPALTMVIPMATGLLFTMWSSQRQNTLTSPFMFMGIITSVTAAVIGVFWALMNHRYARKTEAEEEARRSELFQKYLNRIRRILDGKHAVNKAILDKLYPSVQDYLSFVREKSLRLWERNVNHQDFLHVRLGIGGIPAPNPVQAPKEKFSMVDDALADEPRNIRDEYSRLQNVPITLSLTAHPLVGVIGQTWENCANIARIIAAQIAAYHAYSDVKTVFLYHRGQEADFAFARWLPHAWSEDHGLRMIACDKNGAGEVLFQLSAALRTRLEDDAVGGDRSQDKSRAIPHYVVFISDPSLVEGEAMSKYLYAPSESMGMSVVLLYGAIGRLPNNCTVLIRHDADYSGYFSLDGAFENFENVAFDQVFPGQLEAFARSLSGIHVREAQSAGAIPAMLTFLDMYKAKSTDALDIYRNWLENRTYESMKAVVGYKSADTPLYLDLHEKYHGPHGLVAGTTGSGKSETLQTYILSLSVSYHPHEVSFILIDYKGGGMARSFDGLPHVAGIITNLGGNQTNRALTSINSEIKRRQAVFNEYEIKHIDEYIELFRAKAAGAPMPHLLIIADEFAELKKEQPDFVRELVSASRVGRSLGVHLILATQKPSGVVDDEIWSNAKFRLCLRVQDKQDSNEMIRRPDAAYITNVGRGYFQVGNDEIFETFQSGWSGADYDPEASREERGRGEARIINLWGKPQTVGAVKRRRETDQKNPSQLAAVVHYVAAVAAEHHIQAVGNIWLPPLPERVALSDLPEPAPPLPGELRAVFGLADDPAGQRQFTGCVDLITEGHILIAASGGGGKTTLLQTCLYSLTETYTPDRLNLYIADFGGRTLGVFAALPHVGGIAYDSDADKIDKLIAMILREIARRKLVFSEKGAGAFKEYARLYDDTPAIVFA
ncbi:MAG: type VII secretion protein EssC, partial [Peptococcaceae bacterium]|nr:type VII secretion protein EssC [Peptococcaceae bacterium]